MYTHACARELQSSRSHLVTTNSRIARNVESTRESTDRMNRASSIRTWIDVVAPHSSQHSRVEPTWPTRTLNANMRANEAHATSVLRPISAHQGHRSAQRQCVTHVSHLQDGCEQAQGRARHGARTYSIVTTFELRKT